MDFIMVQAIVSIVVVVHAEVGEFMKCVFHVIMGMSISKPRSHVAVGVRS